MSEDSAQEKTEDPTPRRRQKFKDRGEVASSQELAAAIMLVASTAAIWLLTSMSAKTIGLKLKRVWAVCDQTEQFISAPLLLISELVVAITYAMAPVFAITFLAGILAYLLQTGLIWTWEPLKPSFQSLNVFSGIKKTFFSQQTLAQLVKTLAKVVLIASVAVAALMVVASDVLTLTRRPPEAFAGYLEKIAVYPLFACGATMLIVGVADFIWQKYQMEQKMKMTPQEKKREKKETEGDPQVKQKRKEKHREVLDLNALIDDVPEADVVVNNPTHYSVALKYEPDKGAPYVMAKGKDYKALRIREIAEEHDVPQVDNPPLARALHANVEEDEQIPEKFYQAVARVLAFVWRQQGIMPDV